MNVVALIRRARRASIMVVTLAGIGVALMAGPARAALGDDITGGTETGRPPAAETWRSDASSA